MNGSGYTIVQAGAEVPAEEFVRRYVDLKDPTQRQTLTEPGLSGLSIGFIDDGAVYCPLTTDTEKCYRVALDLSECTRVAIPREQRPTDYDALLDQIYAAVGAIDNRMALRTLRARYSETGSLTSLEMTVWSLQEKTYSLNSWADVHVSVQRSGKIGAQPLSLGLTAKDATQQAIHRQVVLGRAGVGDDHMGHAGGDLLDAFAPVFVHIDDHVGRRQLAQAREVHVLGAAHFGDGLQDRPRVDAKARPPDQLPGQPQIAHQLGERGHQRDDPRRARMGLVAMAACVHQEIFIIVVLHHRASISGAAPLLDGTWNKHPRPHSHLKQANPSSHGEDHENRRSQGNQEP